MSIVDIVFLALIFIAQPIHGAWAWRRYVRAVEAGAAPDRRHLYRMTQLGHWSAFGILLVAWAWQGRPLAWLGIHGEFGAGFFVVGALGAAVLAWLAVSAARMKTMDPEEKRRLRTSLGSLAHFLPRDDRELKTFFALSFSAGVVEEFVYRGFMLWVLFQVMPPWLAVLLSSLAFGLAHSYQGFAGIARTGAIGLAFALIFLGSGSLWLPMLFHFLVDVVQGVQLRELLRDESPGEPAGVPAESIESA